MCNRLMVRASIIAALGIGFLFPVSAQDTMLDKIAAAIAGVAAEMQNARGELNKMKTEENELAKKKIALDKETTRLAQEQKNLPREATQFELDQKNADNYNASIIAMGCRPGEQGPAELADKCNPLIANFNRMQGELNIRGPKLLARGKQHPIDRQKLTDDTASWALDIRRVRLAIQDLETKIGALQSRDAVCPGLSPRPSREEIKLKCGNVQFDGARLNLPPCQTTACIQFDSLFGSR